MKICVFGAGAIGSYLAIHLAQVADVELSVVARGDHLAAIKRNGLTLRSSRGEVRAEVRASDRPADFGPQDVVILALKTNQVAPALGDMTPLLGPQTAVVPPTTGIPYWYFHGLPGPFRDRQVERLDPAGRQWQVLGPQRAIGCVFWVGAELIAPGVIRQEGSLSRFPMGEPDGTESERVRRLAAAMSAAGLEAPVVADIRAWIWAKMISSLCWNSIATLTTANLGEIIASPTVMPIVRTMMDEAYVLARRTGIEHMPISAEQIIATAAKAGGHKPSMLQDLQRGKGLELDVLIDSIESMRDLAGSPIPIIHTVLSLLSLRAQMHHQSTHERVASASTAGATGVTSGS